MSVTVGGRKTAYNDLHPKKAESSPMNSRLIPRESNEYQVTTTEESTRFNSCDITLSSIVTHNQGIKSLESIALDGNSGRMNDDFCGIISQGARSSSRPP